ncbi:MAG TPA: sensor histidine kinase [Caulobacteraceae bacterium]|jgi:two-component sensor histidine kinase|nr:sensor histidine kinase [Caulobacteraceae bacterium]
MLDFEDRRAAGPCSPIDARLSEAHHRIANNLAVIASFLRLEASGLPERMLSAAEARAMLAAVEARLETVARLHRLLSANPSGARVDLGDYVASTCEVLSQSLAFDGETTLTCRAEGCDIDAGQAALVGLIVNELVINAAKYAHPAGAPGRIEVACAASRSGQPVVTVRDDGVGLPEGFKPEADGGLGLKIVRSLQRQLEGRVEFESSPLGLNVRLTLPRESPLQAG